MLTASSTNEVDVDCKKRNLTMRRNLFIRNLIFRPEEVKWNLVSTCCRQFYTCSLWVRFIILFRVDYCRCLLGPEQVMFALFNVSIHHEVVRFAAFGLCTRVELTTNELFMPL